MTIRTKTIDRYFNEVNASKSITAEEEVELSKRIKNGDQAALEKLVTANLRFVISVAKQYAGTGDMLAELIAQGNIGLIDAAKTFDHTRGFKFISYAVWHIRKEILYYLNSLNRVVRLPGHAGVDLSRARKVEDFLSSKLGREPSLYEITEEMERNGWEVTPAVLAHMQGVSNGGIPLESTNPDEEYAPINWLNSGSEPTVNLMREDVKKVFMMLTAGLSTTEREIIFLKFGLNSGEPLTYGEIGSRYNRTAEWSRIACKKAITKMKSRAKNLKIASEL
jgi:RNA polymerase primary sigma factor